MTVQSIKVRVQRRPTVKLKVLPRFPTDVLASSPMQIDRTGGAYQFSLDIDALSVDVLSARPITGTANEISVAHGDGLGGNPTISLPSALTFTGKTVTGGTFNDILSMTAHKANSTANSIAATATLAQFYAGQSANPVTDKLPTVSISRYDGASIDTAGSYNSALLVDVVGNQGNPGGGLFPQASGIVSRVVQNGFGDALGMGVEVVGNGGGGRFAYGYFFNVWAKVAAQGAFGIEGLIVNDTANLPFNSGDSVYLAGANLGAAGSWNTTAGVYFTPVFGKKFDVGVLFGAGSIQQASIFDDSNSVTILKAYGSHTDGIDLTHGTFSGSPFKSTGFSVSNVGAVTALSLTTPVVYGGTAANSALILKSTTNGSPSGDVAYLQGSAIVLRNQQNAASLVSIGASGQSQSNLQMAGSTSGSVTLTTAAAATGTLTLPNATDTLVGKATTDTLTNKSMSGATNTFTSIPISTAISGLGTGVATALGVNVGSAGAFVTFNGALGTPSSGTLSNCTGLPVSTGISGLGTGVATALASGVREKLTANRTYYVRTDGSDSNNGLANTSGGAFLTIQKAIDTAVALDLATYDVTIQLGAGTYSVSGGNELKSIVGAGKIIIVGDETTPSNVTVTQTGSPTNSQGCFYAFGVQGVYSLRGMKLTSATTPGYGINISGGSRVEYQNMNFGAITTYHVRAVDGATLEVTGDYTISGGAVGHVVASSSTVRCQSRTITLSGTPAFSGQFANATAVGYYIASGLTFSGSATGPRYSATLNGVINTAGGGASYFPGDSAGSTATGGQYA